jgi:hypothetical protein
VQAFGMGTDLYGPVFDQARTFFGGSADFNNQYLNEVWESSTQINPELYFRVSGLRPRAFTA